MGGDKKIGAVVLILSGLLLSLLMTSAAQSTIAVSKINSLSLDVWELRRELAALKDKIGSHP